MRCADRQAGASTLTMQSADPPPSSNTTVTRLLVLLLAVAIIPGCRDDSDGEDDGSAATEGTEGGSGGSETGAATGSETGRGDETGSAETGEDVGPWDSLNERPCPPDSFLTYENFGAPYMLNFCTGCHGSGVPADQRQGAPVEVNFDTMEDVQDQAAMVWAVAADQNSSMPPAGAPGDEERAMLGEWLACGAPKAAEVGME